MAGSLLLYRRYISVGIRAQLQYRASFVMTVAGSLAATGIEFVGIWALFRKFGGLHGWRLQDVALFYGVVNIAFAITEAVGRGFDIFPNMVKTGDFDRLLLRPRSTALQVLCTDLQLMRIARLAQGLAVLIWAVHSSGIPLLSVSGLLIVCAIAGGVSVFMGLFVLQATLSFWTVETLEIMNTVTYGGNETAQYPLTIYRPWFRRFFTFVVPLACANFLPLGPVLRLNSIGIPAALASPLIGVAFLCLSLLAWQTGVRHYHSTGS
jgi:ABC-2 type transport system permease protein